VGSCATRMPLGLHLSYAAVACLVSCVGYLGSWALSYTFGFSIIRGLGFVLPVRVHNVRYIPRWGYVWTMELSSRGGYQAESLHLVRARRSLDLRGPFTRFRARTPN